MLLGGSQRAGWIALLALVSVLGLQVLEAGHHHAPEDNVARCQLCSNPTGLAITAKAAPLPPLVSSKPIFTTATPLLLCTARASYSSRAPPYFS